MLNFKRIPFGDPKKLRAWLEQRLEEEQRVTSPDQLEARREAAQVQEFARLRELLDQKIIDGHTHIECNALAADYLVELLERSGWMAHVGMSRDTTEKRVVSWRPPKEKGAE